MKRSEVLFSIALVPLDYLMIILAALAAYHLRFGETVSELRPVIYELPFLNFLNIALVIGIIWIICFAVAGLYAMTATRKFRQELSKLFLASSTAVLIIILAFFFKRELFSSRFIIIATWVLGILFVGAGRIIIKIIQQQFFKRGYGVHRVVIVGGDATSDIIAGELYQNKKLGFRVVEHLKNFEEASQKQMEKIAEKFGIDEIIQADPNLPQEENWALIDYANEHHYAFRYAADIHKTQATNIEVAPIAGIPVIELKKTPLDGWGKIIKRIFDIIISGALIIILSPLMLLMAIAIKLDSPGPIFFSYERVGEKGRSFKYFKFRSMKHGTHWMRYSEEFKEKYQDVRAGTPLKKFKNDPRITRVGRFIRRWSLDELAELFNVFIGRMSLVGPRPHEIEEVAKYQKGHKRVLDIKPGMTGMAQVSGRSDLSFEDEVRLDTLYIEEWSLILDIIILLKTPLAVTKKRGAA
ncbi:MAG: sugar transferase [Patescibacteria group bacterium]|nr:sugar transferase [Patescibacteria group bacterium]MDD5490983.1 sugar transferase [Patescibacteria group bacterium]